VAEYCHNSCLMCQRFARTCGRRRLRNCIVSDGLQNMQQTLLQFIIVVLPRLIHLLLDDAQYLLGLVDMVEVRTVLWPQIRWNESRRYLIDKVYSVRFATIRTSNFRTVLQQHTECMMRSITWVCCKYSSSSEIILKIRSELTKLLSCVWCTTFWDTVYIRLEIYFVSFLEC